MNTELQIILGLFCDIQTKFSVQQTQPAQRGHVRGTAVEGTCNQGMRNCQMLKAGSPDQNKSSGIKQGVSAEFIVTSHFILVKVFILSTS